MTVNLTEAERNGTNMAKYEKAFRGDFDNFVNTMDQWIVNASASANLEDGSNYRCQGFRCAVRVFERYSIIGSNRVSLSMTVVSDGDVLFVSVITSGGSQAVFFKINTLGEESFLETAINAIEDYIQRYGAPLSPLPY